MKYLLYAVVCVLLGGCVIPQQQYNPSLAPLDEKLPGTVNGDAKEQARFGLSMVRSEGYSVMPALPDSGRRWLLAAAEAGNRDAQVNMGMLYKSPSLRNIDGKSDEIAWYWYMRAARQGTQRAYVMLKNWDNKKSYPLIDAVERCQWTLLAAWNPAGFNCDKLGLNAEQFEQAKARAGAWKANVKPENPGHQEGEGGAE